MEKSINVQVQLMDEKRLQTHQTLLEFANHIFRKHNELFFETEFPYEEKVKILLALNISPDAFSKQLLS